VPKFYVKWQMDPTKTPANPEEMVKGWLLMAEMVKADMKAGKIKDFGVAAGAAGGYAIREEASETDLFTALLKWLPSVQFEVTPVLTVDQAVESIKKAAAAAKK
jgi:hypothetical protein